MFFTGQQVWDSDTLIWKIAFPLSKELRGGWGVRALILGLSSAVPFPRVPVWGKLGVRIQSPQPLLKPCSPSHTHLEDSCHCSRPTGGDFLYCVSRRALLGFPLFPLLFEIHPHLSAFAWAGSTSALLSPSSHLTSSQKPSGMSPSVRVYTPGLHPSFRHSQSAA